MKPKDIVYLTVAALAFSVAGFVLITQLGGRSAANRTTNPTTEVVTPISAEFDTKALDVLTNPKRTQDFTPLIDPNSGLGNQKPFSPL